MPSLFELQKAFSVSINHHSDEVLSYVRSSHHLTAAEHVAIYRNSMLSALQKTLTDIYPVTHKLVGQSFFNAMTGSYLESHVSQSYDLADYGATLADFVLGYQPAQSTSYLSDVARLEWAWHRLALASAPRGIDFQRLAACDAELAEAICFHLAPESSLIATPYPIDRIWAVNQADYYGEQSITLPDNEIFYFLVWRQDDVMRIDKLNHFEWHVLSLVKRRLSLGQIGDAISDVMTAEQFANILPQLISHGWLAEADIPSENFIHRIN